MYRLTAQYRALSRSNATYISHCFQVPIFPPKMPALYIYPSHFPTPCIAKAKRTSFISVLTISFTSASKKRLFSANHFIFNVPTTSITAAIQVFNFHWSPSSTLQSKH